MKWKERGEGPRENFTIKLSISFPSQKRKRKKKVSISFIQDCQVCFRPVCFLEGFDALKRDKVNYKFYLLLFFLQNLCLAKKRGAIVQPNDKKIKKCIHFQPFTFINFFQSSSLTLEVVLHVQQPQLLHRIKILFFVLFCFLFFCFVLGRGETCFIKLKPKLHYFEENYIKKEDLQSTLISHTQRGVNSALLTF